MCIFLSSLSLASDELRAVCACVCVCTPLLANWLAFVPAVNFRLPSFSPSERRQAGGQTYFSCCLNFCVLHELLKLLAKAA